MTHKNARKLTVAGLLAAGLVANVALAAAGGGAGGEKWEARKAEVLQKFDTNKDGTLDETERQALRAEREARHQEMVQKYDANKDGTLDEAERQKMHEAHMVERFKALDTNGDGVLSQSEFLAGAPKGGMGHHGRHGRR